MTTRYRVSPGVTVLTPTSKASPIAKRLRAGTLLPEDMFTPQWISENLRDKYIMVAHPDDKVAPGLVLGAPGTDTNPPPIDGRDDPKDRQRTLGEVRTENKDRPAVTPSPSQPAPAVVPDEDEDDDDRDEAEQAGDAAMKAALAEGKTEQEASALANAAAAKVRETMKRASDAKTAPSPWTVDPRALKGKTLEQLNVMIAEKVTKSGIAVVAPFPTIEEARAFLSMDFGKKV